MFFFHLLWVTIRLIWSAECFIVALMVVQEKPIKLVMTAVGIVFAGWAILGGIHGF